MKKIGFLFAVCAAAILLIAMSLCAFAECAEHAWGEWETDLGHPCDQPQWSVRYCTVCGKSEETFLSPKEHEWGEWNYENEPCNRDSGKRRFCINCGEEEYVNLGKIGNHSFKAWKDVSYPTCLEDGLKTRTCRYCGLVEEEILPSFGGHVIQFLEYAEPVNCISPERETYFCINCDYIEYRDTDNYEANGPHLWSEEKEYIPPSCYELGWEIRRCLLCGREESWQIDFEKHSFGEWELIDLPSCKADGREHRYCSVCGFVETNLVRYEGDHVWGEWFVMEEAFCAPGWEGRNCTVCDGFEVREIPATGQHDWRPSDFRMPSCQDGYDSQTCSVCGLVETTVIPATGVHYWSPYLMETPSTCIESGSRFKVCQYCGEIEAEDTGTRPHIWRGWIPNPDGSFDCYCAYCGYREAYWFGENPFKDIKPDKWYTMSVSFCFDMGYMTGVSADNFDYRGTMDRQMFAVILAKIDGADLFGYTEMSFSDVKPGQWYSAAIEWAYQNGYASGIGEDVYGRKNFVTREQLAVFFYTYSQKKGYDVSGRADLSSYADLSNAHSWALDALGWAVSEGIISGTGENILSPRDSATRAQVSAIIMTYMQTVPNYTSSKE